MLHDHFTIQICANLLIHLLYDPVLFNRINLVFNLIVRHNCCEGLLWLWFSRIHSITSPEGQRFYTLLLISRGGTPTALYDGLNGVCQRDNHDRLTQLPSYIFLSKSWHPIKPLLDKIIWNHIQVQSAGTWPSSHFGWIEKDDMAHV